MPSTKSKYELHVEKWSNCKRCRLHETRTRVCFSRGNANADIVFIGEAPGDGEDTSGEPFVGNAGDLLDKIIAMSVPQRLRIAFYNIISCIPKEEDEDGKLKKREPEPDEVDACRPKLEEFLRLMNPSLIVAVGTLAGDELDPDTANSVNIGSAELVKIVHPSYILRRKISVRSTSINQCVVRITNGIEEAGLA